MRRLESESTSLDEKLQRAMQQMHKLQRSIQQRRSATTAASPNPPLLEGDVCNAEMQCHAETLKALLDGLYKAIG